MGWFIVIILLLMIFISYILFAPFYLEINSRSGLIRVRFHRLASARLMVNDDVLGIQWKIAGWGRTLNFLAQPEARPPKAKHEVEQKEKSVKKRRTVSIKQIRAILRSFYIEKCEISWDTGDMPVNGILYPVFLWIGAHFKKNITINFMEENVLVLTVRNRLAHLVWAFIKGK